MIRRVHIENYGCIERLDVDLDPFTVFVGPNACGKSTLLRACAEQPVHTPRRGGAWATVVRHDSGGELGWGHGSSDRNLPIQFKVDALRMRPTVQRQLVPDPAGSNLINVLASMSRRVREGIARDFCALVPVFRDVDVRPPTDGASGIYELAFEDKRQPGVWFGPQEVSDGSIFVLAYLTLLHLEPIPHVLRIEEPEHGLHPYLVRELVGLLRKMSQGKLSDGRPPIQVLVATHSATLLDALEPEEVRFMTRLENGEIRVDRAPADRDDWRDVYETYERSLGGLWLSGGMGAVPGAE